MFIKYLFISLTWAFVLVSIPSILRAPPKSWFNAIRIPVYEFKLETFEPPPPPPPLDIIGTFQGFVTGDNIVDQLAGQKIAEVACKTTFQANAPLYDGSTQTVELVVPFNQNFDEDIDYTMSLQVLCHALQHAFETQIPTKINAIIKNWGTAAADRRADLRAVTLYRVDEATLNSMPMGTVGCESTTNCSAAGIPAIFYARYLFPSELKDQAELCYSDLAVNNGSARLRAKVSYRNSRGTPLYGGSHAEFGMYNFFLTQQCFAFVTALSGENTALVKGAVAGAGVIESNVVTIRHPTPTTALPPTP
jgi:hypothetical protein